MLRGDALWFGPKAGALDQARPGPWSYHSDPCISHQINQNCFHGPFGGRWAVQVMSVVNASAKATKDMVMITARTGDVHRLWPDDVTTARKWCEAIQVGEGSWHP